MELSIISIVLGILLLVAYMIIKNAKFKCNTKIKAIYIKSNRYISTTGRHGIVTQYAPVFKYIFNEKEYVQQSLQTFTEKKIKQLEPEKQYSIFVDANKPTKFIISKETELSDIVMLILSICFIIGGLLVLIIS